MYNLQYVEYLQQTLIEISLSAVLEKLTYKSYIVTGVGIVEAVLFHLVRDLPKNKLPGLEREKFKGKRV